MMISLRSTFVASYLKNRHSSLLWCMQFCLSFCQCLQASWDPKILAFRAFWNYRIDYIHYTHHRCSSTDQICADVDLISKEFIKTTAVIFSSQGTRLLILILALAKLAVNCRDSGAVVLCYCTEVDSATAFISVGDDDHQGDGACAGASSLLYLIFCLFRQSPRSHSCLGHHLPSRHPQDERNGQCDVDT